MLASIKKGGRDTKLEEIEKSAAVLTELQWGEAKLCTSEGHLVKYLTPFLKHIIERDGMCIVNSEDFPWLKTNGAAQKPDLFLSSLWCYETRIPGEKTAWKQDEGYRFGVIADSRLYDNVYLLDAKCNCTPTALGELIIHLQHLASPFDHAVVRGMLFGHSEFWLIECQGNELISRKVGTWIMPGSVEHIRNHFPGLLWCGLEDICQALEAKVVDPNHSNSGKPESAFLGIGGFGRVVKVSKGDTLLALKVVKKGNATVLATEHSILQKHYEGCSCSLVARPFSRVVETPGLCGYLLGPVGRRCVSRELIESSEISTVDILTALLRLHIHSPSIIHGDPRLANLIIGIDDSLFWIDLMRSQVGLIADDLFVHFQFDMMTLLESISDSLVHPFSEQLRAAIDSYCHCPSYITIQTIAELIITPT